MKEKCFLDSALYLFCFIIIVSAIHTFGAACWLRRGRLAINRYPLIYGFRAAAAAAADKEKFINIWAAIKVTV